MLIKKITFSDVYFYNCELQIRVKTFKNRKNKKVKKITFSDFYCLINTKFWITNEKMFTKKIIFSDVYCFISTIVNYK